MKNGKEEWRMTTKDKLFWRRKMEGRKDERREKTEDENELI